MKAIPYFLMFMLAACATGPNLREPVELPEEAVEFAFGYSMAFDRLLDAVKEEGYRVAVEDPRIGIIQTYPKEISKLALDPALRLQGLYRIQVYGNRDRSWAFIDFIVIPELPGEREKIIRRLRDAASPAP